MLLLLFFYQAGLLGLVLSDTKIHDKCTFSSRWFSNNCVTGKSFSSVTQTCLTLHDPMDCSMPGLPVPHQLPEFAQVLIHCFGDASQPSHPLRPPSPPALNVNQHQGLFQWVDCSHQMAKLLKLQLQHQSFQWISRADFLWDWLVGSPCSPRDS